MGGCWEGIGGGGCGGGERGICKVFKGSCEQTMRII